MEIIEVTEKYKCLYFACLEDWAKEYKEAEDCKQKWCHYMSDKGLGVKLARDKNGKIGGMIQYIPIEHSFADGKNIYFITCIWVLGKVKGYDNFKRKGVGSMLLKAAETDALSRGAKGIAAWGVTLPFWMKASWFKSYGYEKVDKNGIQILMFKPFTDDASPPKWFRQKKNIENIPGKVTVTFFINGWCSSQNIVYDRTKRVSKEFGDKVVFQEIDTMDRKTFLEWGISDGLFIDGKEVNIGPPPSYEKLKKMIQKKVKRL